MFGIASVGGDVFSRHSYDDDGHEKAIASIKSCTFDANDLTLLRLDIVRLMCGVTEKFHSVRDVTNTKEQRKYCDKLCKGACCDNGSIFLPGMTNNESYQHTTSDGRSDSSICSDCSADSSSTNSSDSSFHPLEEEDEIDGSNDLYCAHNNTETHNVRRGTSNGNDDVNVQEGLGDGIDDRSTDGRDDIGVEEMYSDYKTASEPTRCLPVMNDNWSSDDVTSTPDNLVCPGDVIEYCTINMDTAVKRHSVKIIVDNINRSYIILSDGLILRPKCHAVRKVKMYCSDTGVLVPNPLSEWHRLEKCILQSGFVDTPDESTNDSDNESLHILSEQNQRR